MKKVKVTLYNHLFNAVYCSELMISSKFFWKIFSEKHFSNSGSLITPSVRYYLIKIYPLNIGITNGFTIAKIVLLKKNNFMYDINFSNTIY